MLPLSRQSDSCKVVKEYFNNAGPVHPAATLRKFNLSWMGCRHIENTLKLMGLSNYLERALHLHSLPTWTHVSRTSTEAESGEGARVSGGFERWQKIYGETDDVNPVQKDSGQQGTLFDLICLPE